MRQDGLRVVQEERKAREKGHPLRHLQGLLDQPEDAREIQGALRFPFLIFLFFPSTASGAPANAF